MGPLLFKLLLLSDQLVLQDKGIIAQCSVYQQVSFQFLYISCWGFLGEEVYSDKLGFLHA